MHLRCSISARQPAGKMEKQQEKSVKYNAVQTRSMFSEKTLRCWLMIVSAGLGTFSKTTCSCSTLVLGIPGYSGFRRGHNESIHRKSHCDQLKSEPQLPFCCSCIRSSHSFRSLARPYETQRLVTCIRNNESGASVPLLLLYLYFLGAGTILATLANPTQLDQFRAGPFIRQVRALVYWLHCSVPGEELPRNCLFQDVNSHHDGL